MKRYVLFHCEQSYMDESVDGDYVLYSEVQSLQAERDRLREALKEALDWMEAVEPELSRIDGGYSFDGAPLTIARRALEGEKG